MTHQHVQLRRQLAPRGWQRKGARQPIATVAPGDEVKAGDGRPMLALDLYPLRSQSHTDALGHQGGAEQDQDDGGKFQMNDQAD